MFKRDALGGVILIPQSREKDLSKADLNTLFQRE